MNDRLRATYEAAKASARTDKTRDLLDACWAHVQSALRRIADPKATKSERLEAANDLFVAAAVIGSYCPQSPSSLTHQAGSIGASGGSESGKTRARKAEPWQTHAKKLAKEAIAAGITKQDDIVDFVEERWDHKDALRSPPHLKRLLTLWKRAGELLPG